MTLSEAIDAIETVCTVDDVEEWKPDQVETVASGGIMASPEDPIPGLFASKDLAVAAWRDAVIGLIRAKKPSAICITDGPHLDTHVMTSQSATHQQRVVEPRYSVTSTIGLVGLASKSD